MRGEDIAGNVEAVKEPADAAFTTKAFGVEQNSKSMRGYTLRFTIQPGAALFSHGFHVRSHDPDVLVSEAVNGERRF